MTAGIVADCRGKFDSSVLQVSRSQWFLVVPPKHSVTMTTSVNQCFSFNGLSRKFIASVYCAVANPASVVII